MHAFASELVSWAKLGFGRRGSSRASHAACFASVMLHSLRALSRRPAHQLWKSAEPSISAALSFDASLSTSSLNKLQIDNPASEQLTAAEAEMALFDSARKSLKRKAAEAFLQSRYQQATAAHKTHSSVDSMHPPHTWPHAHNFRLPVIRLLRRAGVILTYRCHTYIGTLWLRLRYRRATTSPISATPPD